MRESAKYVDDTKNRLIDAAGEVFAQYGFRSATVREICSRAGTHVGSVNYHFRDKKGLYAAVMEYSHKAAVSRYPPDLGLTEKATAEDKLRAFIHSFLLRMLADGFPAWHGKLMAREVADPSGALDQVVENSIRPLHACLISIVKELMHAENAPDGETDDAMFLAAMSVVGQCLHHHIAKHIIAALRPDGFDPARIERLTDHITRFSIGGIHALCEKKTAEPRL